MQNFFTRCEVEYVTYSKTENILDNLFGIQENKNQINQVDFDPRFIRLLEEMYRSKGLEMWGFYNEKLEVDDQSNHSIASEEDIVERAEVLLTEDHPIPSEEDLMERAEEFSIRESQIDIQQNYEEALEVVNDAALADILTESLDTRVDIPQDTTLPRCSEPTDNVQHIEDTEVALEYKIDCFLKNKFIKDNIIRRLVTEEDRILFIQFYDKFIK